MVAMDRDSKFAAEAAMKYFVLGALASGILLYGISMLYGAVGTLDLTELKTQGLAERVIYSCFSGWCLFWWVLDLNLE